VLLGRKIKLLLLLPLLLLLTLRAFLPLPF
jgi:hypothetical protein